MNNEVSSNYLYHFTRKLDTIQNILIDKAFKPFYCLERLDYLSIPNESGTPHEMAFPMVCFCDLPDDKQIKQRQEFGEYSISLCKEWGVKRLLTPVTYCSKRTLSSLSLKIIIQHSSEIINVISDEQFNKLRNSLSILLMHFKSYEGYSYDKELKHYNRDTTRFYDEREWRYLPIEVDNLKWHLTRTEYENHHILNEMNTKIQEKNCLKFDWSDIFQIQVKEEKDRDVLLKNLSHKYPKDQLLTIEGKIVIITI